MDQLLCHPIPRLLSPMENSDPGKMTRATTTGGYRAPPVMSSLRCAECVRSAQ